MLSNVMWNNVMLRIVMLSNVMFERPFATEDTLFQFSVNLTEF